MFDIEALKNTIIAALTVLYNDNYPEVKESIDGYLIALNERLALLTEASLRGEVEFVGARLKDELTLLESELIALKVIGLGIAEDAIENILNSVKVFIPETI